MTQKYERELFIMGIDLSKAFDCVDRKLLMETLEKLLHDKPSELRIIKYLLSNTSLTARLQGIYGKPFNTTLGIPQGDGLSPALFIIYLQAAADYHRNNQRKTDTTFGKDVLTTHYADDTDFISTQYGQLFGISLALETDLQHYNLQMNAGKTEYTTINPTTCTTTPTKKLGTYLAQTKDMNNRINLGRKAFSTMNRIWFNKEQITVKTKLFLYNMFIKPVMLYNTSCLGASEHQLKRFDTTHRTHLRLLANIRYPKTITNRDVAFVLSRGLLSFV